MGKSLDSGLGALSELFGVNDDAIELLRKAMEWVRHAEKLADKGEILESHHYQRAAADFIYLALVSTLERMAQIKLKSKRATHAMMKKIKEIDSTLPSRFEKLCKFFHDKCYHQGECGSWDEFKTNIQEAEIVIFRIMYAAADVKMRG